MLQLNKKLNSILTKFYQAIEDLEKTGFVIKGIDEGLLDFPSKRFDDEIWLCWKQGENPKEFVYGLIVGSALTTGITGLVQIKKELPTPEDQIKIRDMVYKKIPQIRERIFG